MCMRVDLREHYLKGERTVNVAMELLDDDK